MLKIVKANPMLPAVTAQDVGRDLCQKRQDVVQIIGEKPTLDTIAWIFQRIPDMFTARFRDASLIVCRAGDPTGRTEAEEHGFEMASAVLKRMPLAH